MEANLTVYVEKLVEQLQEERQLIDQAIFDLERLQQGRKRPRGRPPGRSNASSRLSRPRVWTAGAGGDQAGPEH